MSASTLAYGLFTGKLANILVGPGNAFVAEAKAVLNGTGHCLGLRGTEGQQENFPGIHDRANTHRDDMPRDIFGARKKTGIVLPRARRECLDACTRSQRRAGFVEPNVAVAADAEDLQIDSAAVTDALLVISTMGGDIVDIAVRNVYVAWVDINVPKQLIVHEGMVGLRVIDRQPDVFVEIEGPYPTPVEIHPDQLPVETQRRTASRQAEDGIGFALNQRSNGTRSDFGRLIRGRLDDQFHKKFRG